MQRLNEILSADLSSNLKLLDLNFAHNSLFLTKLFLSGIIIHNPFICITTFQYPDFERSGYIAFLK